MLPVVVEWTREGDKFVGRIERYRVDIRGMHEIGNYPLVLLKAMSETEKMLAERAKAQAPPDG